MLRLTRMPAVRLELGHLSSARDAARLADPGFRDTVAEAVLVAVQRLYLPPSSTRRPGMMRLPDLGPVRRRELAAYAPNAAALRSALTGSALDPVQQDLRFLDRRRRASATT